MANSPTETVEDCWWTNLDLAARYQLPVETIRKWRSIGSGPPAARFGRHVRYRKSDVLRWEEERAGR